MLPKFGKASLGGLALTTGFNWCKQVHVDESWSDYLCILEARLDIITIYYEYKVCYHNWKSVVILCSKSMNCKVCDDLIVDVNFLSWVNSVGSELI